MGDGTTAEDTTGYLAEGILVATMVMVALVATVAAAAMAVVVVVTVEEVYPNFS
ncbi:hypothetical protein LPJ53_004268 [Coemansia erecta]|uniref:Uncharacterized protein n=1 Tax=Coemansia erecta TaxID=147472 RepID=A0A9W7XXI9_9FUNG|nr:hypothetical protein LPJ53_004268 [Coemansia erecta]